jgi:dephospho-CoA kinase
MLSIGITGGIGSGKSTICKILEQLGYPVFYADIVAKQNMLENLDLIQAITHVFGHEAYTDKQLNRNFLSNQIFQKPELKEKLNGLVHPTVYQSFERWKKDQESPLVFNESALLFETGSYKRFDAIWLVIADEEDRIRRVIKRENCSRQEVLSRIKNQLSDAEKIQFPSEKIYNSENDLVLDQVLQLLEKYSTK